MGDQSKPQDQPAPAGENPSEKSEIESLPKPIIVQPGPVPKFEMFPVKPPTFTMPEVKPADGGLDASNPPKFTVYAKPGLNIPAMPPGFNPSLPLQSDTIPKADSPLVATQPENPPLLRIPTSPPVFKPPTEVYHPAAEIPSPGFKPSPPEVPSPSFQARNEGPGTGFRPMVQAGGQIGGGGGFAGGQMQGGDGKGGQLGQQVGGKVMFGPPVYQASNKAGQPHQNPSESPKPSPWIGAQTPPRMYASHIQPQFGKAEESKDLRQPQPYQAPPAHLTASVPIRSHAEPAPALLRPISDLSSPRPLFDLIRKQANLTDDTRHWACSVCTLENEYQFYQCEACMQENKVLKGIVEALGIKTEAREKGTIKKGTEAITSYFKSFF